jgi:hypothetical protein
VNAPDVSVEKSWKSIGFEGKVLGVILEVVVVIRKRRRNIRMG